MTISYGRPEDPTETERIEVMKKATMIPMGAEAIADDAGLAEAYHRFWNATPEQREQWAREAAERRATERAAAQRVPLSLDALLSKLGWSQQYATHFVQPYCTCGDSYDGWDYCKHARDEGLVP